MDKILSYMLWVTLIGPENLMVPFKLTHPVILWSLQVAQDLPGEYVSFASDYESSKQQSALSNLPSLVLQKDKNKFACLLP